MPNKSFDVVAIGELLIDFTQNGYSAQGNPLMEVNPGGAPCNMLSMLQNLGWKTAFIGKVGNDLFGEMLREAVQQQGIDTQALYSDPYIHTTLAFVHTKPDGDREFSFYRNPGADELLQPKEVPPELIRSAKVLHFGTLSLTHPCSKEATETAVKLAKEAGCLLSFDPNLRPPLWQREENMRKACCWGLENCDVLKIADNELEFLTGHTDFDRAVEWLQREYPHIRLLNVTAGANGSYSYYNGMRAYVPAFTGKDTIETTGAGDCFCANVLGYLLEHGIDALSQQDLQQMLRFANAAAYLVTTKKGALRVMPKKTDVETFVRLNTK